MRFFAFILFTCFALAVWGQENSGIAIERWTVDKYGVREMNLRVGNLHFRIDDSYRRVRVVSDAAHYHYADGLVSQITLQDGGSISLTHTENQLATVHSSKNDFARFTYHPNGFLATAMGNFADQALSLNFDGEGRLIRVLLGTTETWVLNYSGLLLTCVTHLDERLTLHYSPDGSISVSGGLPSIPTEVRVDDYLSD